MKFFETSDHLARKLTEAEQEIDRLREEIRRAKVREFYRHMTNALTGEKSETEWGDFYNSDFTISFRGRSVTLYNGAEVFQSIEALLESYMEDEGIEYK